MGRAPCCDKANVKRGPWSPEEDAKLKEFIEKFGTGGNWIALPQKVGLKRCGKSCRLRWLNYLRPNIKHGEFTDEEDRIICTLYASIGSRWSIIAAQLPGRTDNDIKNYWNTKLKKKLMGMANMIPSNQYAKFSQPFSANIQNQSLSSLSHSQLYNDYNSSLYFQPAASSNSSAPQNFLYCINNSESNFSLSTPTQYSYYQQKQEGLVDLLQHYYHSGKLDNNNNMLVFGGNNEPSCSSSDGSCSHISYGKDSHVIKQEEMGCSLIQGFNISSNNGIIEDYQSQKKFMLLHQYGNVHDDHVDPISSSAFLDQKQLECDLEEVKQLISTGNGSICNINNGNSNFLFNDENNTHRERGMYYY